MLILHNLAEPPRDSEDIPEVIRFMVQSLSIEDSSTINFLVSIWSFYLSKAYLTKKQSDRLFDIFEEFMNCAMIQFPERFKTEENGSIH